MKTTRILLQAGSCFAAMVFLLGAKPTQLNWRAVDLPSLNWSRTPVDGGGALYAIAGNGERKFRLDFRFASGIHAFPRERIVAIEAFADMLLLGGAGKRSYEDLANYLQENGIDVATEISSQGNVAVQLSGLSEDLPLALKVAEDILLKPRMLPEGLDLWKQDKNDSFQSLIDGGSQAKQRRFLAYELNKLSLGPDHVLTQTLKRMNSKSIAGVNPADLQTLTQGLINRAGLNVFLSGGFTRKDEEAALELIGKIPRKPVLPSLWLPERPSREPAKNVRFAVISKPDLKQSQVEIRILATSSGELNQLEKSRLRIASEILSSSGGVVGTDRWSKAMRADSGFSYAPAAFFNDNLVSPNTNVGLWRLMFQSPNERVYDACVLAKKTWEEFTEKGISADETENARVAEMNSILALESTIFDKASALIQTIEDGDFPSPVGRELWLARLEQERDPEAINQSLRRLTVKDALPVMVILGNPDDKQISQLKKEKGFEFVEALTFAQLAKEVQ